MPTISAEDLACDCIALHYPRWDTLGMEESSLLFDISREGQSYLLITMPLVSLPSEGDVDCEIDECKVNVYRARVQAGENCPPLVLRRDFSVIDGNHRLVALHDAKSMDCACWIPADKETIETAVFGGAVIHRD